MQNFNKDIRDFSFDYLGGIYKDMPKNKQTALLSPNLYSFFNKRIVSMSLFGFYNEPNISALLKTFLRNSRKSTSNHLR